jgi:hypothetical protein
MTYETAARGGRGRKSSLRKPPPLRRRGGTTFADVGALAWWLRMISFTVPFSLDRERARLLHLHEVSVPLVVRERRFLVEARKR